MRRTDAWRSARAADRVDDAGHSFADGITAINGGRMDCFNPIGFVQYQQADIPNYWSYAQHFTLADQFFSSIYGPTGVEHLWTFASQSDRFVDHERPGQFGTGRREFCDDPSELAFSLPMVDRTRSRSTSTSWRSRAPRGAAQVETCYRPRWPCTDVTVLPDRLEAAGIVVEGVPRRERVGAAAADGAACAVQLDVRQRRGARDSSCRTFATTRCRRSRG